MSAAHFSKLEGITEGATKVEENATNGKLAAILVQGTQLLKPGAFMKTDTADSAAILVQGTQLLKLRSCHTRFLSTPAAILVQGTQLLKLIRRSEEQAARRLQS